MSKSVSLVNGVGISFGCVRILIGAFSVVYLLDHGLTLTEIGWIKSFQAAVIVFVDIPLSHISDKYSRKFSITLSAFCASIWLYLTGASDHFYGFLVAEFFNALSLGLMLGTFNSYLYDVSKNNDKNEIAEKIFSRYQKNHFFFMGIFSLVGAVLYSQNNINVWYISAALMFLVFISSLFLPKDNLNKSGNSATLKETLNNIMTSVFGKKSDTKNFIYINIVFSMFLQILIQYWQVMMTYSSEFLDKNILLGVVFFAILMSQSLAGLAIERSKNKLVLKITLSFSLLLSGSFSVISMYYPILTIPSLCSIFFTMSTFASLSLSQLVENTPRDIRSTLLSSLAVLSKIVMFIIMPISAILINKLGVNFNLILILTMFFCIKYIITPTDNRE